MDLASFQTCATCNAGFHLVAGQPGICTRQRYGLCTQDEVLYFTFGGGKFKDKFYCDRCLVQWPKYLLTKTNSSTFGNINPPCADCVRCSAMYRCSSDRQWQAAQPADLTHVHIEAAAVQAAPPLPLLPPPGLSPEPIIAIADDEGQSQPGNSRIS